MTIIHDTMEWERKLTRLGWKAPITLERARGELDEALDAVTKEEVASEIGDTLQVILRYCERQGIDPLLSLASSLDRNRTRTLYCLRHYGLPTSEEDMTRMWAEAKAYEYATATKKPGA